MLSETTQLIFVPCNRIKKGKLVVTLWFTVEIVTMLHWAYCCHFSYCFFSESSRSFPHIGAPVVASFPHFHLADDKYVSAIEGMSPQREHHQTFLDLNPVGHQATASTTLFTFQLSIKLMLWHCWSHGTLQSTFEICRNYSSHWTVVKVEWHAALKSTASPPSGL